MELILMYLITCFALPVLAICIIIKYYFKCKLWYKEQLNNRYEDKA